MKRVEPYSERFHLDVADGHYVKNLLFFPDLVKHEKVYVLDTPLFRVRNKQETIYCYDESEKQAAIKRPPLPSTAVPGKGDNH